MYYRKQDGGDNDGETNDIFLERTTCKKKFNAKASRKWT